MSKQAKSLPSHVEGLLRFLATPTEKSSEDLVLTYFRTLYPSSFQRQAAATGADGYVPGHFILELKGRTNDWFSAVCQSVAYNRELDFSTIVVAAKEFLGVWLVEDIPIDMRSEILQATGSPSAVGKRMAKTLEAYRGKVLKKTIWSGNHLIDQLLATNVDGVRRELANFEETLRATRRVRRSVTPKNFCGVLREMTQYFDDEHPTRAVNAFYSMVYAWREHSVLEVSERTPDQATLGGELVRDLIPGKRMLFKDFVESHTVRLKPHEHIDDFFARYDEALDAVDRGYRVRHGVFFTDLSLSKFALWVAKQHVEDLGKNYIVIDPACGSGNLVTNWRSPLELRHKVVSEISPDLLYVVEKRMKGDRWHDGKFTVVPKTSEGRGLNFLERSAREYLNEVGSYLADKGHQPDKPIAFLCNPPYRSDDDQTSGPTDYDVHQSIIDVVGRDASAERYCCFLAQMSLICKEAKASGLPGESVLLLFTKSAWLTDRVMFQRLRRNILGDFEDCAGFLVNGKAFFDVNGKFPVAFTVWRYVGPKAQLDESRSIPVVDLTHLRKQDLSELPWENPDLLQEKCQTLVQDARVVPLGASQEPMKSWIGKGTTDFKRGRRKAEEGIKTGGLPIGDARLSNTKVYGEPSGTTVGFMDDLTPCRTLKRAAEVPHFHLDPRMMRLRDSRCLSGHSSHYSYQAQTPDEAERLFFWYALGRTFSEFGYPMWADAMEVWAPSPNYEPDKDVLAYALAIGFAENECVETVFPGNNPVRGANELHVRNPMSPDIDSFWSRNLDPIVRQSGVVGPNRLVRKVKDLYGLWSTRFVTQNELFVPYKRNYFVDGGVLGKSAGILQIRDYAVETNDSDLLEALRDMRENLRAVKGEFNNILVGDDAIDYFGSGPRDVQSTPTPRKPLFETVLEKRLVLANRIVAELKDDRNLGRTKLAKIFYLADLVNGLELQADYRREAAGPLDARAVYNEKIGIEAIAARRGCFTTKVSGRSIRYVPGPEQATVLLKGKSLFGSNWVGIKDVIELCRPLSTDQSEIVATLYACWNDLLGGGVEVTHEQIIHEFSYNWHEQKRRFPRRRLVNALAWMEENGLMPRTKPTALRAAATLRKREGAAKGPNDGPPCSPLLSPAAAV